MRGYMAWGPSNPWEQRLGCGPFGPDCGPFGPYGRFGCHERRPGPGFFDGRPGCCQDDSGPESGERRHGQEDSGPEGPRRQGRCRCSGRRGRGCESSDEEARERSCSPERRDGIPGRRRGCRHHHRGPFGVGGPFGHEGPFRHLGPFGHRGPFGPYRGHFGHQGCWGHRPSFGPFGAHFGHHGGHRGPFGPEDCDFGRGNCHCRRMGGRKGCCSKNKDQNKDGETEGARRKKHGPCGPQDKDQSGTVLVQRIVVETPRSYSV